MGDGQRDSSLLRDYLADRDVSCPQCAYNLRALTGDTCPECGERIILRVGLVEPRQKAVIAGLIGLACGAGFNAMLLVYAIYDFIMTYRTSSMFYLFLAITGTGLAIFGAALAFWLVRWRWIRVRPGGQRWALVAGCWAAVVVDLITFTAYIR